MPRVRISAGEFHPFQKLKIPNHDNEKRICLMQRGGNEKDTTINSADMTTTTTTTTIPDCSSMMMITDDEFKMLMKIRTITCFVTLTPRNGVNNNEETSRGTSSSSSSTDADNNNNDSTSYYSIDETIASAAQFLKSAAQVYTTAGYTVQTLRIATNPFGEWLNIQNQESVKHQLQHLDSLLQLHEIEFCALGPATTIKHVLEICPLIVQTSYRLSCSAQLHANHVQMAHACATCIKTISLLDNGKHVANGLGNFRFAVAINCNNKTSIPFFPVAATKSTSKSTSSGSSSSENNRCRLAFAIGMENGVLANHLLAQCGSITNIATIFKSNMYRALLPIQTLAHDITKNKDYHQSSPLEVDFLGIDTSLNPSLAADGSIARAMEQLKEVIVFGGPGTMAAAAAITTCLQSFPPKEIQCTGYCGLMLPVCEDQRLVQLTSGSGVNTTTTGEGVKGEERRLQIADLLSISSVCGVGIDTVPIAGNFNEQVLTSLLLDVAGLAERWDKSLSCRVLPMPGKDTNSMTSFDSPYMMNTKIMNLL